MANRRYYTNFPHPNTIPPPRRTSITGTAHDIHDLRVAHPQIVSKWSYNRRTNAYLTEHLITEYHRAEQAFHNKQYALCQDQCFGILASEPLSDTIKAKTFMLLATEEVLPESAGERAHYAEQAMVSWDVVIGRVGYCHTRFPIAAAREQREKAVELHKAARKAEDEELANTFVGPDDDKENVTPEETPPPAAESQEL